jgi:putative transposase
MSKPDRPLRKKGEYLQARTFFVTSPTRGRRSLFRAERMARLFLDVLAAYRAQGRYLLHDFVLMPDHFHALISVPPGMTVERAVQFIKGGFSYRAKKELGFHGEVWQRCFADEYVPNVAEYESRRAYIRLNPVRAGLAKAPEEYPYGSAGSGTQTDPAPAHLRG